MCVCVYFIGTCRQALVQLNNGARAAMKRCPREPYCLTVYRNLQMLLDTRIETNLLQFKLASFTCYIFTKFSHQYSIAGASWPIMDYAQSVYEFSGERDNFKNSGDNMEGTYADGTYDSNRGKATVLLLRYTEIRPV